MRTLRILGVVIGALALSAASCDDLLTATGSTKRPAQEIYISQAYDAPYDARKGDTVIIIMEPDAVDPQTYCDNRGGELWRNPYTDILMCWGVDF